MSNNLIKKGLPVTNGVIQTYEREGFAINTEPIAEFFLLEAQGLTNNQVAVFELSEYGVNALPVQILAKFAANPTGNITLTIKKGTIVVFSSAIPSASVAAGFNLPQIPLPNQDRIIEVQVSGQVDFLWISFKQISIVSIFPPTRIT